MRTHRGVYEHPPNTGRWWAEWYDEEGRRHRRLCGEGSRGERDAHRYVTARRLEAQARRLFPQPKEPEPLTLAALVERYLPEFEGNRTYREAVRYAAFWQEYFGPRKVAAEVLPGEVARWQMKARMLASAATVNRYLAFLRRVYYLAFRDELLTRNPAARVKALVENNARTRWLTPEEEACLAEHLEPRWWPAVEFAIHTGLRQGEQFGLRWQDVDLERGFLVILRSKHGQRRYVHLNPTARRILERLPREGEHVFGGAPPRQLLRVDFPAACRAAGIEDFRWHDLRHTFASRLALAGQSALVIKEALGHRSLKMTERYAHLQASHLRAAVQSIAKEEG